MKEWHYTKDGKKRGPIMESTLLDLWGKEKLPPETLVWTEGMSEWVEIQHVKALSNTFTARVSSRPAGMNDWVESKHVESSSKRFSKKNVIVVAVVVLLVFLILVFSRSEAIVSNFFLVAVAGLFMAAVNMVKKRL